MSLLDETASLEEVAAAIRRPPEWLMRKWRKLADETGFPRKHASGWTWPRAAVRAWLNASPTGEEPRPSSANDNQGNAPDYVSAYEAALAERYGGLS